MCIKYVNATVRLYENVELTPTNEPIVFANPFNGLIATSSDDMKYSVGNFSIVTRICIIGTASEENKKNNILHNKGCLDVLVRLTKCDMDESKRLAVDVDKFEIDIANSQDLCEHACFPFLNFTRITKVPLIGIAELGNYIVKILIKERQSKKYTIQSMYQLKIASSSKE